MLVDDLATEWWLISLDCVILVAKCTITGHYSLDWLVSRYLLNKSKVDLIIELVLAERCQFTQLCSHMVPGYCKWA